MYSSFRFIPHTEQFTNLSLIQNNSQIWSIPIELSPIQNNSQILSFSLHCPPNRTIHKLFSHTEQFSKFVNSHWVISHTEQFTKLSPIQNHSHFFFIPIELSPIQNHSQFPPYSHWVISHTKQFANIVFPIGYLLERTGNNLYNSLCTISHNSHMPCTMIYFLTNQFTFFLNSNWVISHTEQFTNLSLIQNDSQILSLILNNSQMLSFPYSYLLQFINFIIPFEKSHIQNNLQFLLFPLNYLPYRAIHKLCHFYGIIYKLCLLLHNSQNVPLLWHNSQIVSLLWHNS